MHLKTQLCVSAILRVCICIRVWWTSFLCRPAKAISWELLMFTRPLNRGCYQPWSRCMFSFTCTGIQFHIHTYARTKSFFRTLAHTLTPSPEWPSRRACLCQQMSGRRCVFLCLLRHSFHPPLQRLPICLWPCFISAHSSPPQEDASESVVLQGQEWKAQTPSVKDTVVHQYNL